MKWRAETLKTTGRQHEPDGRSSSQQTQASTPPLIPITKPYLGEEEAQAAAEAIRTGWIAQGPLVARFEEAIAARLGVAHVVATSNCTTSLHLALLCSGVGPGDEVIVPLVHLHRHGERCPACRRAPGLR